MAPDRFLTPAVYDIRNRDGRWRMAVREREFASFATEHHAIRVAIDTAYQAARFRLFGAVVVLHGPDRVSRVVWTYGHDPFPPTRFE